MSIMVVFHDQPGVNQPGNARSQLRFGRSSAFPAPAEAAKMFREVRIGSGTPRSASLSKSELK